MTWRQTNIARLSDSIKDPDAREADLCALFREWLRLSGRGVLRIPSHVGDLRGVAGPIGLAARAHEATVGRAILRLSARALAVSWAVAAHLRSVEPGLAVDVVPNGVDRFRFTPGDQAPHPGLRVGFLGGAISIDKRHRTEGRSWWREEEVTEGESRLFDGVDPVDILCTHDSPIIPPGLGGLHPKLTEECDRHRELIARALDDSGAGLLLHGHYHVRYTGKRYDVRVEGLAHGYSPLGDFTLLVDTDEIRRG